MKYLDQSFFLAHADPAAAQLAHVCHMLRAVPSEKRRVAPAADDVDVDSERTLVNRRLDIDGGRDIYAVIVDRAPNPSRSIVPGINPRESYSYSLSPSSRKKPCSWRRKWPPDGRRGSCCWRSISVGRECSLKLLCLRSLKTEFGIWSTG